MIDLHIYYVCAVFIFTMYVQMSTLPYSSCRKVDNPNNETNK